MAKKTHINKLRDTNYLGSWDLMDESGAIINKVLTIQKVKKDTVFDGKGGKEDCIILEFKEAKPMVLNSTNIKAVTKVVGSPFIEDWKGKTIEITVEAVKAFGEIHPALRVVKGKQELHPDHPKWEGAKQALKEKSVTISQIKKTYLLSPQNEKELIK